MKESDSNWSFVGFVFAFVFEYALYVPLLCHRMIEIVYIYMSIMFNLFPLLIPTPTRMIRLLHTTCGIPWAIACLHQSLFCTFLLPHAIYRTVSSNRHWFHIYNQICMNAIYTRFGALLVCYLSITVVFACGTRLKLILYSLQTLTCLWIAIYACFSVW